MYTLRLSISEISIGSPSDPNLLGDGFGFGQSGTVSDEGGPGERLRRLSNFQFKFPPTLTLAVTANYPIIADCQVNVGYG